MNASVHPQEKDSKGHTVDGALAGSEAEDC
jgi:hypothetical protein